MDICCTHHESTILSRHRGTYEVVAVIVTFLRAYAHLHFIVPSVARGLEEVLWEQLAILIEVVPGALVQHRAGQFPRALQ